MIHFVKALKKSDPNDRNKASRSGESILRTNHTSVLSNITLNMTRKVMIDKDVIKMRRILIDDKENNNPAVTSAYKDLRTAVLSKLDHMKAKTLMITSPVQGNGKTSTALNLAINIARLGQRTALLVDMDLRYPSIHHYLGIETDHGIVDVINGKISVEKAMITPNIDRLTIIPGKKRYRNSSEIIASQAMRSLVKELRNRYRERVIIFDCPPLLGCDDSTVMASLADACLVVVEEGSTSYNELDEAMLKLGDVNLVGYVLNKSKSQNFDRYYY